MQPSVQPACVPNRQRYRHRPQPLLGRCGVGVFFAFACLLSASFATADDAWVAHVRGVGASTLPAGTPLQVVAQDFTESDIRLQPTIERALTAQGYAVDPQAALQLVYATQLSTEPGAEEAADEDAGEENGDLSDELNTGPNTAEFKDVAPQVNLQLRHAATTGLSNYALSFVLGMAGQMPLWRGSVTAALPPQDPLPIVEAMVPMLVPAIGKTVEAEHAFPQ